MIRFTAACIQPNTGTDWRTNLAANTPLIEAAVSDGANYIQTPEVTNFIYRRRTDTMENTRSEADDPSLAAYRELAAKLGVWLNLGSLALRGESDERLVNRSFLINPNGEITNRYDKIHMFDVDVSETETYRESAGFRPGNQAIVCDTPLGTLGLTICYDLRFPALHRSLAEAGAQILTIPAAFSPVTGEAHWEVLLRARAIETGCFVLAPAQTGSHLQTSGKERKTYGHSMAISPWGEIIVDAGTDEGVTFVDIDINDVAKARNRIPSLKHARKFESPNV